MNSFSITKPNGDSQVSSSQVETFCEHQNGFIFEPSIKSEGCAFILEEHIWNQFLDSHQIEQEKILGEFYIKVNETIESFM